MRWTYKLENKLGRFRIPHLMLAIVVGMAVVYLAQRIFPTVPIYYYLQFDRSLIFSGQVWRVVTYLFLPGEGNPFWFLFSLYFYYMLGNILEGIWGSFRFTLFYVTGWLLSVLAGFLVGYTYNAALNSTLFFAVATFMPDMVFRLFFIIPIKAKWLAFGYLVFAIPPIVLSFMASPLTGLFSLCITLAALVNFFLHCGRQFIDMVKNQIRIYNNRRNWNRRGR